MRAIVGVSLALALAGSAKAEPAVATAVEAPGPAGPLKGTMLAPAGALRGPVVLMTPGSGPTDRDGDNPLGVKAATLRRLAEALAERGVATVRIDKRGMFASAGAGDPNAVTLDAYAADTHAWVAEIRRRTGAPCVWLLGHSEGALVSLVAAQAPEGICGLVLVAAPGRPFDVILAEQLDHAGAPFADRARSLMADLKAGRAVDVSADPPLLQSLFGPPVRGFMTSLLRTDPASLVKAFKGPILVLQGTTDLQVSLADAEALAAARDGVKLVKLAGVNHVLKVAPADRAQNLASYLDPNLPLAPGIAEAVAEFVKAR